MYKSSVWLEDVNASYIEQWTAYGPSSASCGPVSCHDYACIPVVGRRRAVIVDDQGVEMRCEQRTSGGGWTIIQERSNRGISFYRNMSDYKKGFRQDRDMWIGLDALHSMTSVQNYTLRVELIHGHRKTFSFAEYYTFGVSDEKSGFRLHIGTFMRNSSLTDGLSKHNGGVFCAKDSSMMWCRQIAKSYQTGWWLPEHHETISSDLNSNLWSRQRESRVFWLKRSAIWQTRMLIRPTTTANISNRYCNKLMHCDDGQTCNYFSDNKKFACSCTLGEYCQSNVTLAHPYAVGNRQYWIFCILTVGLIGNSITAISQLIING